MKTITISQSFLEWTIFYPKCNIPMLLVMAFFKVTHLKIYLSVNKVNIRALADGPLPSPTVL